MEQKIVLTSAPIVIPPLALPSHEIGACVEFQGIVREMEEGRALRGLHYEAYEPMARRQLARLFDELATAHPCEAATFIHRLGWVPVGEASLFIRVLAAHRGEALTFCALAIEQLKKDVPIWKIKPASRSVGWKGLTDEQLRDLAFQDQTSKPFAP
jgi:molybdopterin synthase catalytic subunit